MDDAGLIAGLRDGDELAMTEFARRYRTALEHIAAGAISPDLRRRISPESVAQSVCRTFLRRMESNPYVLQDVSSLWSLLCAIVLTKVREKVRYHKRERRRAGREIPLEEAQGVVDAAPSPAELAAFREAFEQVLGDIDHEERRIFELRLYGKTQEEIGAELGCSERTVRRLLGALEQKLRRRLEPRE
ncbi:MAG: sigma-70 family RNA polymerase sigma factor [Planctomycetota bacterium]